MTDVFVSYKRDDLPVVQALIKGLRASGVSVWWDKDIPLDAPWEQTIEREHRLAKVVLVVWSEASVQSDNVKAEARPARDERRLLQIFLGPCTLPMFFGERQGLDFAGWNGALNDPRFKALVTAVESLKVGRKPAAGVGYVLPKLTPWTSARMLWSHSWRVIVILSVVIGLVAGLPSFRDAVCKIGFLSGECKALHIVPRAPAPSADPATAMRLAREKLIASLNGQWVRSDSDCKHPMTITTSAGSDGLDRIKVTYGGNFESEGQVESAEGDVVTSRDINVKPGASRDFHEFQLHGDELTVVDKSGNHTSLVRCRTAG